MDKTYFCDMEFKVSDAENGVGLISGYGARTGNKDLHGDVIEKGAFVDVASSNIPMLREHDPNQLIGLWHMGVEKDQGFWVEGKIDLEDDDAKKAHRQAKAGLLKGLSIGFLPDRKSVVWDLENGIRKIVKIKTLFEVSLVVIPANPRAQIQNVKSITDTLFTPRMFERFLKHEKNLSAQQAKTLTNEFKKFIQGNINLDEDEIEREADTEMAKDAGELNDMLRSFAIKRDADEIATMLKSTHLRIA